MQKITRGDLRMIPRFKGYFAHRSGRIFYEANGQLREKSYRVKFHYRVIRVRQDSIYKDFKVHRLVLEAFEGVCPKGKDGLHWDDDKMNNDINNLYWGTRSQNEIDRLRNGRHVKKGTHSVDLKREVKASFPAMSIYAISKKFDLNPGTVHYIVHNWSDNECYRKITGHNGTSTEDRVETQGKVCGSNLSTTTKGLW